MEQIDFDPDYVNENIDVNSQLENIGISPISNHAKAKSTRISTGRRKLSQINVFSVSISKKLISHVKKYLNKILLLIIIVLISRTINNF